MKEIFNDILDISAVKGAIFIDKNNEIKIEGYTTLPEPNLNPLDLAAFMNTIGAHIETDHILVITDFSVQMAMVRLNCDVLEPLIKSKLEKPTGISRFFKK